MVVICLMASIAITGSVRIIACMTATAIGRYRKMCTFKDIIIVVNRETSRFPPRIGGMAGCTFGGNTDRGVVRIGGLVEVVAMA